MTKMMMTMTTTTTTMTTMPTIALSFFSSSSCFLFSFFSVG